MPSRSSDGRKGRACKERRMSFVDTEEVKVEFQRDWSRKEKQIIESWLLISEVQLSLSSSVAEVAINFNIFFKKKHMTGISYQHTQQDCLRDSTPQTSSRYQEQNQPLPQPFLSSFEPCFSSPYSAEVEVQHGNAICAYRTSAEKREMNLQWDSKYHLQRRYLSFTLASGTYHIGSAS